GDRSAHHPHFALAPEPAASHWPVPWLPAALPRRDGRHNPLRYHPAPADLLGAYQSFLLPIDWLLEAPSRGAAGRPHVADGHGYRRLLLERWRADPGEYCRLL